MLTQWKWLLPAGLSLVTTGCLSGPTEGISGAPDADQVSSQTEATAGGNAEEEGNSEETGSPVAREEEDAPVERVRFQGEMDVTYTYSGSFGEFADVCDGSAFVFIEDGNVDGEGICENEIITFGFLIEGSNSDGSLEGILVAESSMGRAETPFDGELDGEAVRLNFDHTHAADGESLRLEGVINLVQDE